MELLKEQIKISATTSINTIGMNSEKIITPQLNYPQSQGAIAPRKPSM